MSMSMLPNMNATTRPVVDTTVFEELANRWPIAATAVFACVVAVLLQSVLKSDPWADLPMIGTEFGGAESRRKKFLSGSAKDMYLEGYKRFKERAWRITTTRASPNIVVAPKFMNELKRLPDDVLSFNKAIEEFMHAKYTKVETDIDLLPHTVKTSLTPALVRLNPIIADEVIEALRIELPHSGEWTEVKIMDKLLRIVAMASGRVFIGPELCREEEYLDAAINYTVDLMKAIRKISDLRPWTRRFVAPGLPEVKKVHERIDAADKFLRPVVTARREAAKDPDYQKPYDMLQWIMDAQTKFGEKDDKELARYQLGISFAAIHTTTVTSTNAFYTLAAMPELIPILREDVQQALAQSNGVFTSLAMQNMKKLDSFLKETMRFYALGSSELKLCLLLETGTLTKAPSASFTRKVLKTFTLSNGQVIPKGSIIEIPMIGINNDDEYFPDHDKFDALRFYKLRQAKTEQETGTKQAEVVALNQFVSVGGPTSLTFGFGRHACPGRFFAVNEIKMIMATTLANYDIKMVEGSTERYKNLDFGSVTQPDPDKKILMRKL
ncbi:Cytochrome P450 monooxygenase ATR2 [Colletotrichum sp. SAR 10_99]|nr:Cytochrome P450 monooxygenase ATR2 [Colletotrichum sp. SAR 10_96]KAI8286166.1 Cytochrome P450 monooxygenase ATR2 [Colletotrichum sp. SAR 10_98]KAJ5018047.1 Cytochrome P450 monooxygenase ATR2 [Colletotrichum sp. SAR 10_99]